MKKGNAILENSLKELLGEKDHVCLPQWEIWDDDNLGDKHEFVFGVDAEEAGIIYASKVEEDEVSE